MKKMVIALIVALFGCHVKAREQPFNGLDNNPGNPFRTSKAKTRSISPENFTGEKISLDYFLASHLQVAYSA